MRYLLRAFDRPQHTAADYCSDLGRYIDRANALAESGTFNMTTLLSIVGLALIYWLLGFVSDLLNRYLYGGEDIERLSKVQDHRLQEKFQAKLFKKISRLYPDYMEVPKINDIINRSFDSMGGEWSSLQRGVIITGYVHPLKPCRY